MWKEENNALKAEFEFADFKEAFAFTAQVAISAEVMNHHPVWKNIYNKVWIELQTHDAGNTVTEKDHKLAAVIDEIYKRYKG